MKSKEKVLVVGGAGFIGSHTSDRLIEKGYDVRILDGLAEPVHVRGDADYIPETAEFIKGDIRDKTTVEKALVGIDVVMHFAAYQDYLPDFSKFFHVNSVGTALLYEVIVEKKFPVRKVLVASSQSVLGEGRYECPKDGFFCPDIRSREQLERGLWDINCPRCGEPGKYLPSDESVVNPQNQYGISKYTQEMISLRLGKRYSIPTTALRYSIVQGPRQSFYNTYSGVCRIFCLGAYLGRESAIYEDGNSVRDYVNIEDVVDANMLALEDARTDYEVFNVGGGKAYTVLQFADIVKNVTGRPLKAVLTGEYRYGDTRHILSDISKLQALGWNPKRSVDKSVHDYMGYLKSRANIKDLSDLCGKKMRTLGVVKRTIK